MVRHQAFATQWRVGLGHLILRRIECQLLVPWQVNVVSKLFPFSFSVCICISSTHSWLLFNVDSEGKTNNYDSGQSVKVKVLVTQSCLNLCDPVDCSPPSSSVHGISQARILECVAVPFSRGSSRPRDWTQVSCIVGRFFTVWATRGAQGGLKLGGF